MQDVLSQATDGRHMFKHKHRMGWTVPTTVIFLGLGALFIKGGFPATAYVFLIAIYGLLTLPGLVSSVVVSDGTVWKRNGIGLKSEVVDLSTLTGFSLSRRATPGKYTASVNIIIKLEDNSGHHVKFPIRAGYWGESSIWDNDGELQTILNTYVKNSGLSYDELAKKVLL